MILSLIESFLEKQKKLPSALRDFESAELKALDTDMSAILEEIYSYEPISIAEFRLLVGFFLDLLAVSDARADPRIVSQIEKLTDYAVTLVPPKGKHLRNYRMR